jgi:hypothetical protein
MVPERRELRNVDPPPIGTEDTPSRSRISFWLLEARGPERLVELARRFPGETQTLTEARSLLGHATAGDLTALRSALDAEARAEQEKDRAYVATLFEVRHEGEPGWLHGRRGEINGEPFDLLNDDPIPREKFRLYARQPGPATRNRRGVDAPFQYGAAFRLEWPYRARHTPAT